MVNRIIFIFVSIVIPSGDFPLVSNWVVPGKRKFGYCSEKEIILASCPLEFKERHNNSSQVASPPRSGKAGPRMNIFFFSNFLFSDLSALAKVTVWANCRKKRPEIMLFYLFGQESVEIRYYCFGINPRMSTFAPQIKSTYKTIK